MLAKDCSNTGSLQLQAQPHAGDKEDGAQSKIVQMFIEVFRFWQISCIKSQDEFGSRVLRYLDGCLHWLENCITYACVLRTGALVFCPEYQFLLEPELDRITPQKRCSWCGLSFSASTLTDTPVRTASKHLGACGYVEVGKS